MSVDQQFNNINDKLQQLLKNHARLKKENECLREELQQQKRISEEASRTIEEFYQQMAILKMAAGNMSDTDKKDFEKKDQPIHPRHRQMHRLPQPITNG